MLNDVIFHTLFSPFSAHQIELDGVLYPTVEHAYHCQRYEDTYIREEIRQARSPMLAWEVSQRNKSRQRRDFNETKVQVMESLCRMKMEQHTDVREALIASGSQRIVKHIVSGPSVDGFWDDGTDGTGRNETGKIWMRLRDELMES
jgi:ribA/ribD-fused uncharacterized protein